MKTENLVSIPLPRQEDLCSPAEKDLVRQKGSPLAREAELWLCARNPLAHLPAPSAFTADAALPGETRCSPVFPNTQLMPRDLGKRKGKQKKVVKASSGLTPRFCHWTRTLHIGFSRLCSASLSSLSKPRLLFAPSRLE